MTKVSRIDSSLTTRQERPKRRVSFSVSDIVGALDSQSAWVSDSRTAKYVRVRAVGQSKCPSEGQSDSQSVPVRDNRTVKVSQWGTVGQSKCPSEGQSDSQSVPVMDRQPESRIVGQC